MRNRVARLDAIVIGGGITGVSLACELVTLGQSVLLMERDQLASGATGRNAGFLVSGVAGCYRDAIQRYGRAQAAEIWRFTNDNHTAFREALGGAQTGYLQRGSWTLAASVGEASDLEESSVLLAEDGFAATWTDSVPSNLVGYFGGLLNPDDAEVESATAVTALAAHLPGGVVRPGVRVDEVVPGRTVMVRADGEEINATAVFMATNGYLTQLLPDIPIAPVRGQMLETESIGRVVADRPVYADHGYQFWRQRGTGSLLVGGWRNTAMESEIGFDDQPTNFIQQQLDAHLVRLGVDTPIARRWAGTMGFTPDHLPLVGAVPDRPGVYVCAGYSGHGMGFAFLCGRLLARSVVLSDPLPGWMSPARFRSAATRDPVHH